MTVGEIRAQHAELSLKYRDLVLVLFPFVDKFVVKGRLQLLSEFKEEGFFLDHNIEIQVPLHFPNEVPSVYETSGKIVPSFQHFMVDGSLCLGVQSEIQLKLLKNPTLLFFVDDIVTSYLYAAAHFKRYGYVPYGERAHGIEGIYEYYYELFDLQSRAQVKSMLQAIGSGEFSLSSICPCGSGKTISKCIHKNLLMNISEAMRKTCKSDFRVLQ